MAHSVCHIEFQVRDLTASKAFLGAVFNWQFREFGDTMVVFGNGDDHVGGITKVDSVTPGTYATVWFDVQDIDATLQLAVAAGGSITAAKGPVPGVGWSGEFTDLDGNPIGIVQFER